MSTGQLLRLVPKRVFDFSNLLLGNIQVVDVLERIDISNGIDCMLAVRVHSATLTGGTITVDLVGDGYTDEDPGVGFATGAPFFASPVPAAVGLATCGGTVRGGYAKLRVIANRTSPAALTATVSIDLILRSPDMV